MTKRGYYSTYARLVYYSNLSVIFSIIEKGVKVYEHLDQGETNFFLKSQIANILSLKDIWISVVTTQLSGVQNKL